MHQGLEDGASRSEKERYWRVIVDQWQESKQSAKAFCQQRGVHAERFSYWRRKLTSASAAGMNKFVKLEVEPRDIKQRGPIIIEHPSQIKIILPLTIDIAQLSQILRLIGIAHD